MTTLTKAELRWMLNFVAKSRDNSKALKDHPGQQYAALHKLEYENMSTLAEKLETVIKSDNKRIAVRRGGGELMKMQPFSPQKTPKNKLLLVYTLDWGFRLAAYRKILPTSDRFVWIMQGTGRFQETNGDWHETADTFWCELPNSGIGI